MSAVAAAVVGTSLYASHQQGKQADRAADNQESAIAAQNAIAEREVVMAEDQYQYYKDTYRPLEEEIVANAGLTRAEQQEMVASAGLTTQTAFDSAEAQRNRSVQRMGINPNSGAYASNTRKSAISKAVAKANSQNTARATAEQMDFSQKSAAVGMGKGLPGSAGALLNSASNSYGQAAQGYGMQAQMYGNSAAQSAQLGLTVLGAGMGADNMKQFGNNLIGNYQTGT